MKTRSLLGVAVLLYMVASMLANPTALLADEDGVFRLGSTSTTKSKDSGGFRVEVDSSSYDWGGPGTLEGNIDLRKAATVHATSIFSFSGFVFGQKDLWPDFPNQTPPENFEESLALLRNAAPSYSNDEKFLLLSDIGYRLLRGYDESKPDTETSLEQLFQNVKVKGGAGGTCREIATYLAEVEKSLGYADTGMHTLSVSQSEGHVVSHFRDPQSGQYYVQNYSLILKTGESNLGRAIDRSVEMFGTLTTVSYVNNSPGHSHAYVPETARWMYHYLDRPALNYKPGIWVTVLANPNEQALTLQTVGGTEKTSASAFLTYAARLLPTGGQAIQIIGVAANLNPAAIATRSKTPEFKISAHADAGVVNYANPGALNYETLNIAPISETDPFWNLNFKGSINFSGLEPYVFSNSRAIGGAGEFPTNLYPAQLIQNFGLGLTAGLQDFPILFDISRVFELVPYSIANPQWVANVAYDKIGLIFDSSQKKRDFYFTLGNDLYMAEGVGSESTTQLAQYLTLHFPKTQLGEFTFSLQSFETLGNPNQDPYYEGDRVLAGNLTLAKSIGKEMDLGATGILSNGGVPSPFLQNRIPSEINPSTQRLPSQGFFWMRLKL